MSTKIAIMSDFEYGKRYYFVGSTSSINDNKCVTAGLFQEGVPISNLTLSASSTAKVKLTMVITSSSDTTKRYTLSNASASWSFLYGVTYTCSKLEYVGSSVDAITIKITSYSGITIISNNGISWSGGGAGGSSSGSLIFSISSASGYINFGKA